MTKNILALNKDFAEDVLSGLSASPKFLSSRYFYDENGDRLFQQIMELPEYYLTRCEYEILNSEKEAIRQLFSNDGRPFQLIEFGAGDGYKTKVLLQHFAHKGAQFKYVPIDISQNVLDQLSEDLAQSLPDLAVSPRQGEYFKALEEIENGGKTRKVVLFLGSNIGNFKPEEAHDFLRTMAQSLHKGDLLFIGFDLKKDPEVILNAYNDSSGVTRAFNLNLLQRMNRELGANFDVANFKHFPIYDPSTGETKSYLASKKDQGVYIEALDKTFHFSAWEPIFMEVSRKYYIAEIEQMAVKAGFRMVKNFYDQKQYFVDSVWEVGF